MTELILRALGMAFTMGRDNLLALDPRLRLLPDDRPRAIGRMRWIMLISNLV